MTGCYTRFKRNVLMDILFNGIRELLVFLKRHLLEIRIVFDAVIDDVAHDVVSQTERNAFSSSAVPQSVQRQNWNMLLM